MSTSRGQTLRIKAEGHLEKTLEEGGGTLRFRSWSGDDEVIDDESLELCEGLDMFDQECPVKAGHLSVSEEFDLEDVFEIPEVSRIPSSHHASQVHCKTITNDLCTRRANCTPRSM